MAFTTDLPGYPGAMPTLIARASARVVAQLERRLPHSRERIRHWLEGLSGSNALAPYFLHPLAFPTLALPYWAAEAAGHALPEDLLEDISCSTINGYLAIRLIDDAMDEAGGETGDDGAMKAGQDHMQLLPMAAVLHAKFQRPYARRFEPAHPFWAAFDTYWARAADATIADRTTAQIGEEEFRTIAAGKVGAALIPLAAVAHHIGRGDLPQSWLRFFSALAEWHQMRNDLRDWQRDARSGAPTYIVSEAERRRGNASIEEWMAHEGLDWALAEVAARLAAAEAASIAFGSPSAACYLAARRADLDGLSRTLSSGLGAIRRLLVATDER